VGQFYKYSYTQKSLMISNVYSKIRLDSSSYGILDALPNFTVLVDESGVLVFANTQALSVSGYAPQELVGLSIDCLIPERNREAHSNYFQAYLINPKLRPMATGLTFCIQRKDGTECPVEISLSPITTDQGKSVICVIHDISDRKKIELAFLGDERFRLFMKYTPSAVAMFDREMHYLAFSTKWLVDYQLDDKDITGLSHYAVFPDIPERWKEIHQRCLAGEVLQAEAEPFLRADGHQDWVSWKMHPWHMATSEIGGAILFTEVVTARKLSEAALRESELRWKFALEGAGDGVWDWNIQTQEVNYSNRWRAMLGYGENDSIPIPQELARSLVHPDDLAYVLNIAEDYLAGNRQAYIAEFRLRCKDGCYKWILSRGQVVSHTKEGKPLRMIGIHTDISAHKRTLQALSDKERMLSESQRIAHIGSWTWDLETGYISWSDEMYRIFGVTREAFGHTIEAFVDLIDPKDVAAMEMWINDSLSGKKMQEVDYRIIWPDGTIRFIRGNGVLEYDKTKRPIRVTGSAQDITERTCREQEAKKHLDELAHVTRLGLMGEMASGIAHELNQPMTAISTYAQACLNFINVREPDLTLLAATLSKMQHQASRAGLIISRMREFVKSDAKRHSTADINALIINCVELCNAEIKQSSIALTVELEENLPSIHVDQIQIEQVLINLIRNSIDALNSIASEIYRRQLAIHSRLLPNHRIEVRVKDNGPGLNEEQKHKILMPFYTTKSEGMGMGLSISRSLIEAHDGTLYFNSQPAKGTSFYFTLPIQFKSDQS